MRTQTPHISLRRPRSKVSTPPLRYRVALVLIAIVAAIGSLLVSPDAQAANSSARTPSGASNASYGWPVKPFDRQHPVRGFFGDPRIGVGARGISHSFHFGVDVSCPDGTPVYATLTGRVVLRAFRAETVSIVSDNGDVTFSYWHVVPSVRNGQVAEAYRTIVGHVAKGWAHVHFAERQGGVYVNPLRPGAMQPYTDATRPQLRSFRIERANRTLSHTPTSGRIDLVIEADDTTPLSIAAPWHDKPVTPAVLRWRNVGAHTWRTAVDVRWTIPNNSRYGNVYAAWTKQNNPWGARGRYRFFLAHDLDAGSFGHGVSSIEVQAIDTCGNSTTQHFTLPGLGKTTTHLTAAKR